MARFSTRDANLAQYVMHQGHRCVVLIDDEQRPVFTFVDTPTLRADIVSFSAGAVVTATAFAKSGNILRKLIRKARFRRAELERRIVAAAPTHRQTFDAETAGAVL